MNKILIIIFLCFVLSPVLGQEKQGNERGEVKDTEFIIRKDRVLTLPKKNKNFEKVPALPQPEGLDKFDYEVRDFFFQLDPSPSKMKPYQKRFESSTGETYHSFVKLGYGNYQSPLAELHLNNLESDYLNYGVYLKHQGFYEGPIDKKNSAEDHTNIRIAANYFMEYFEAFGKIGYDRDKYHFYGYTPNLEINPEDIGQIFHTLFGRGGIRNIDRMDPFNYEISLGARIFNDDYSAREHQVDLNANAYYQISDNFKGGLEGQAFLTSPSDETYSDLNRNYLKASPYLEFKNEKFKLLAGANIILENDEIPGKSSSAHLFPRLKANYQLEEEFGLYASFEGDVQRNTYYSFVQENPYLGPSEKLLNTIQDFKATGGIKGNINDAFTYKFAISYGQYDQMHFYGNHENDSTRFQVVYDSTTNVLNYKGGIGYEFDKIYQLNAEVNYYHYSLESLTGAWHRPKWTLDVRNQFTPDARWLIQANAKVMGGINAINFQSDRTSTLNPIIDLQVKADYKLTDQFSLFVEGNNLLHQRNQRFWNYPSRGIQGIGGLTFKF
ncbi:TonB-dependent receptor [Echinicola jeungdonensis]|uniref:TonB-dependent receptor n=1 Tax=Echinicola jeungdonensis TaxID=709343 RepID=A0ABV5J7Y7_9BACT|nr:TonB-dependent receptor [Echinicola jeungdonensis]MDN3670880.1 TonB-dependent receptor [Echinicola jeungdonensis]